MSSKGDDGNGARPPQGRISEDRPLDSLLPELTRPGTRGAGRGEAPADAVHRRVLDVELEEHREWAMACWYDPGADALAEQLSRLLEVTFLSEFTQPPTATLVERDFRAIRLLVFDTLGEASKDAVDALGFEPTDYVADEYVERMAAWREEAAAAGIDAPTSPAEVYVAEIARPNESIANRLEEIQRTMLAQLDGEVWGETPGGPSKLMATYFRQHFNTTVAPNRDGLHAFELFLVQDKPGVLRWMPPLLFQALCDFVGVILQAEHHLNTQWALCVPDTYGFAPPPVLRVATDAGYEHIPVGQRIVQWCIMARGGHAPTLAERVDELVKNLGVAD